MQVVSRSCVLYSSDASFRTSFCGLKLWMFNMLKDPNPKCKKVEIQTKDQVYDRLKFDASYHVQNDIKG